IRNAACTFAPGDDGRFRRSLDDPTAVARAWVTEGFSWLHVVDHDAAMGIGSNAPLVDDIIRDAHAEIQANGGVQTNEGVQSLFDAGAARVVLSTRAVAEVDWLAPIAELNPGMLVVEITLRERRVITRGWGRRMPHDVFDVAEEFDGLPLGGLLI